MICCLNPACQQPQNSDDAAVCRSCGAELNPLLRNRYRVIQTLGQGGFGRTYLALDEDRLKTRCVIKQFSPQFHGAKSLDKAIEMFSQEAMRLNELGEHPQIPTLLAYFEQSQRLYLVQEFVEGQNLAQELQRQGAFSEQRIRELLQGVLPVLKFIHDRQVIHRDITPTNIMRRQADGRLMLIDFGVSKQVIGVSPIMTGTRIGTEGFSPMEQLRSGKAFPASDLYSLGAICIFLLTQSHPHDLYDPLAGKWVWREQLAQRGGKISDRLAQILDRLLKDLVGDRYQSADEVIKDLNQAMSSPPLVASSGAAHLPLPPPPPMTRPQMTTNTVPSHPPTSWSWPPPPAAPPFGALVCIMRPGGGWGWGLA
ncbi:MAG: serine/threonine-protein kinase, partial [Leptolyngbyaceae cyanobacterium bins.59]|nr:serine/threonine-protein kinase [Leptolyngbyaceae cyanobacterium bins.59]